MTVGGARDIAIVTTGRSNATSVGENGASRTAVRAGWTIGTSRRSITGSTGGNAAIGAAWGTT